MTNFANSAQVNLLKHPNELNSNTLPILSSTAEANNHSGIESVNSSFIRVYIGNGSTVVS